MTHSEIRSSGFWIIGGASLISNFIARCTRCRKLRGPLQEQKMADLPEDRVQPAPPFSYCAVDYFGPWYVKEGCRQVKRYGVLFTCLASRALHLEVANSLTADSFINAYRRFVGRQGPVRQIRSDQGTNFIDGLPIEFYNVFWSSIGKMVVESFNEAYEEGEMSNSQRQGVITLIEKTGKDRTHLENWQCGLVRVVTVPRCLYP